MPRFLINHFIFYYRMLTGHVSLTCLGMIQKTNHFTWNVHAWKWLYSDLSQSREYLQSSTTFFKIRNKVFCPLTKSGILAVKHSRNPTSVRWVERLVHMICYYSLMGCLNNNILCFSRNHCCLILPLRIYCPEGWSRFTTVLRMSQDLIVCLLLSISFYKHVYTNMFQP